MPVRAGRSYMEFEGADHLVFVYGTLMKGEYNHHVLEGARFLRPANTQPEHDLFNLGRYPAMVANGSTSVKGELYAVDDEILARLDRLEGHPEYYKRTAIELADAAQVQTYLMEWEHVDGYPRIPSGDWRRRQEPAR